MSEQQALAVSAPGAAGAASEDQDDDVVVLSGDESPANIWAQDVPMTGDGGGAEAFSVPLDNAASFQLREAAGMAKTSRKRKRGRKKKDQLLSAALTVPLKPSTVSATWGAEAVADSELPSEAAASPLGLRRTNYHPSPTPGPSRAARRAPTLVRNPFAVAALNPFAVLAKTPQTSAPARRLSVGRRRVQQQPQSAARGAPEKEMATGAQLGRSASGARPASAKETPPEPMMSVEVAWTQSAPGAARRRPIQVVDLAEPRSGRRQR